VVSSQNQIRVEVMCLTIQEFDRLSSQTVRNLLNDVDAMLYDPTFNGRCQNLVEECASWTSVFPHMRCVHLQSVATYRLGLCFYALYVNKMRLLLLCAQTAGCYVCVTGVFYCEQC